MELTIHDIIKGPVISDKAYKSNTQNNKLVLVVHIDANKPMVKLALEKLFNVKVKSVRTLVLKYKAASLNRKRRVASPKIKEEKRAIVTLADGYSLDLFDRPTAADTTDAGSSRKSE